jgi:hypothetical protein
MAVLTAAVVALALVVLVAAPEVEVPALVLAVEVAEPGALEFELHAARAKAAAMTSGGTAISRTNDPRLGFVIGKG